MYIDIYIYTYIYIYLDLLKALEKNKKLHGFPT